MCVTQILSVFHNVWLNLDSNTQTDVLLLNFSKAFDSVDHNILLATLNAYGISDNLQSWLTNYLSACFQRAVLEGASSQWAPITSGAPQGSLLAPLMFVIFINDLPDASNGEVNTALYADDSKIFGAVKCIYDCEVVQTTLSNMDEWTGYNIQFNTSKCKVLTVTCKKQPMHYDYTLKNVQLTCVAEENDLGTIGTSTLSWVKHINAIVAKAISYLVF